MIKAIIFDCFGVIRIDATFNAYKQLGGDPVKDNKFIVDTINNSNAGLIPAAPIIASKLGVTEKKWRDTVQSSSEIDDEILRHIKILRKSYKTAMLSNISQGGLSRWFDPGVLDKYFDVVIGSGDIGFAKPEPEAYEITVDRLGVRLDECVFIDDRQEYCDGARAVGMKAILYQNFRQMKTELEKLLGS